MKTLSKLALSIVPVLGLAFVINDFFGVIAIDFALYQKLWTAMLVLTVVFYVFLFTSIWSERIAKDKKVTHTALSFFFFPYSLYYIWFLAGMETEEQP